MPNSSLSDPQNLMAENLQTLILSHSEVSSLYFKFTFKKKKSMHYLSIRANRSVLSGPSAQHLMWSTSWPLWKCGFPETDQFIQIWIFLENNNFIFDVYLGRKNLAEQFVDKRWVEKLLSQFTGTGRKKKSQWSTYTSSYYWLKQLTAHTAH